MREEKADSLDLFQRFSVVADREDKVIISEMREREKDHLSFREISLIVQRLIYV